MNSNNPYDNNSGVFDKVMGTAFAGGAAYAGYKAVTDAEGFQNSMMKVVNAIAPVKQRQTGIDIKKDMIADSRDKMLAMEKHSSERQSVLTAAKSAKTAKNIAAGEWKKVRIDHNELGELSTLGHEFRFTSLDQVKDISGESIGSKFTEALNKLGMDVQGKPTFKGTTAVFNVMENGRVQELEIPFAAQDAKTGAWISKKGDAEFITHLKGSVEQHKAGGLKMTIRGHNESMLEMLASPDRIAGQAMSSRDSWLRDIEQISSGKIKDAKKLEQLVNNATTASVLENVSMFRLLKKAIGMSGGDAKENWVTATADSLKAAQSGYVQMDQHSLRQLNSVMPGTSSNVIGVNAANQDMDKQLQYLGDTYKSILGYPQQLRSDLSRGDSSRISLPYKGKEITKANLHLVDNAVTRSHFEAILNGGLGFNLAQEQTAEYTMSTHVGYTASQVERNKSEKGLLYLNENIGTRSINGVTGKKLERLRTYPTIMDRSLVKAQEGRIGGAKAERDMFMGERKGLVNLFGMINPVGKEEYIGIAGDIYKDMKAFQPVQWSVSRMLSSTGDKGLLNRSMVDIEYWQTIDGKSKKFKDSRKMLEIFEDRELRENLRKSNKLNIKMGKDAILGLTETGGEVWNNESLDAILGREGQNLLNRGANIHIDKSSFERMLVDNADMQKMADGSWVPRDENAPMKFYGYIEGQATKVAVNKSRHRGLVYGRIENEAKGMASAAGMSAELEFLPHIDIFKKILPQSSESGHILQKGSPETMQFLQESMMGHLMAYNKDGVTLKGDIASRFSKYLGIGDRKELNLTEQLMRGNMQWTQMIGDTAQFGEQLHDTASVLGAMKEHIYKKSGNLVLDGTFNRDQGATHLADAWDRATGNDAVKMFEDIHAGKSIAQREARGHAWNVFSGIMPQEITAMTQGTGFNTMNISFRDMHYFADKSGILEEFAYQNTTNSTRIAQQMDLMKMSLGGDQKFGGALEAYEERIGQKIKTYKPEELGSLLGEFGGSHFTSDIKHTGVYKNSFLNGEINPHGFMVDIGDRNMFVGGGEMFGESYFLPKSGKVTVEDFAMNTASMINKIFMRKGVDVNELKQFQFDMGKQLISSKNGLLNIAAMSVDYASYAKHVVDKDLLHNDFLKFGGAHGEEVSNLLGNATKIAASDYRQMLHQQLADNLVIAKEKGRTLTQQLEIGLGKENFFSKYQTQIDGIASLKDIGAVSDNILKHQSSVADQIYKEAMAMNGKDVSEIQAAKIRKLVAEDSLSGLWVRHPAIYGSSYSAGAILPDAGMLEKTMAPGRVALTNLFGDFDGDASMLKAVYSKTGRLQTQKLIDQTQKHTANVISAFKSSMKDGPMSLFMAPETRRTAALTKDLSSEMAVQLIHNAPVDSALAAYYTKSLTGALNVKAQGVKGFMDDRIANARFSETELSKVHAFFSTIPSLFTEQKAISSKQAERILGRKAGMDNVTELIGSITSQRMIESIQATNGDINPLITMALASGEHKSQFTDEHVKIIKNIADLNLNMRTLNNEELKEIYGVLHPKGSDIEAKIAAYRDMIKINIPFLETAEGKKLKFAEGTGIIDIIKQSMDSSKGFSSENIQSWLGKVLELHNKGAKAELEELFVNHAINDSYHMSQAMQMLTPEPFHTGKKGMFSDRAIKGWDEVKKFGSWLTQEGKAGGRIGGLAAAVLGGFTALNLLSGDGTPENPNDLPSVNNPSFSSPRSNPMLARRTMSPDLNYNSNVSLLTDNRTPHTMLTGAVQNMFGSSSVTVSDGTNPYLKDMYTYSNN